MSDCLLLDDRGYLSQSIQLDLLQTANIKLETPKRIDQKDYKPQSISLESQKKELKQYALNYVFSSKLGTIMLKLLKVLKQEF